MATSTQRARATKIRKLVRSDMATAEQRHWLGRYEAERKRQPRASRSASGARETPAPELSARPPSAAAPAPVGAVPAPQQSAASAENSGAQPNLLGDMVKLEVPSDKPDGKTASGASPNSPGMNICDIPDCPCKKTNGALICKTTNQKVYPPMSSMGAAFMAAALLALLAQAIKFLRPDRQLVPPTEKEKQDMGVAIREVAHRRANFVGAIDDLLMLGGATMQYTLRASGEPSKEPTKAPEPEAIPNASGL